MASISTHPETAMPQHFLLTAEARSLSVREVSTLSCEYRADDGTTNNQAESYFSRFRRMEIGQTQQFGTRYLANYANEAAYREDTRRCTNGEVFHHILTMCARTLTYREWCGYWQGNKRLQ
jgi:hypothetical protein